jgi:uncharacterized protein
VDRLEAEARWAWERLRQRSRRTLRRGRQELPSDTPDLCRRVRELRDLLIPMRDGVRLAADVYLPGDDLRGRPSSYPAVLVRLPYGKREAYCYMPAHGRFWARRGYACVVQDVRGRFASEGSFEPYANEAADGWDTLDWVAAQPWCNGDIGMTGESYYGSTQWAVAALGHPCLRCLAPGDVHPDRYSNVHDGGALSFATAAVWHFEMNHQRYLNHYRFDSWHLPLGSTDDAAGRRSPWYQALIAHPSRDAFWDAAVAHIRFEDVTVPMMHWSGWYDVHTNGAVDGWSLVRERCRDPVARSRQHLVLGAGDHELSPEFTGFAGRTPVPGLGFTHDRVRRFMDHYLKGEDNGVADEPRVRYYLTGAGEWRAAGAWPPEDTAVVELYLHGGGRAAAGASGGGLSRTAPGESAADHYLYDPADPAGFWLGRNVWEMASAMGDRRPLEGRPDVLVYTAEESGTALDIVGPVAVTLFAASSARDTDFTAALTDVFPDGFVQLIREGIVRARYRDSERDPSLIEPGRVYEYTIDLGSVAYRLPGSHRLRLEISSSSFDRWDRNLNGGGVFGHETRPVVAEQTVLHDAAHPSGVRLTVLPPGPTGG